MKIINGGARTGKTFQAIKQCVEEDLTLVVFNAQERQRIFKCYPEEFREISPVFTFQDILKGRFSPVNIRGFVFDDADLMLQSLVNFSRVDMVTVSASTVEPLRIKNQFGAPTYTITAVLDEDLSGRGVISFPIGKPYTIFKAQVIECTITLTEGFERKYEMVIVGDAIPTAEELAFCCGEDATMSKRWNGWHARVATFSD